MTCSSLEKLHFRKVTCVPQVFYSRIHDCSITQIYKWKKNKHSLYSYLEEYSFMVYNCNYQNKTIKLTSTIHFCVT